VIIYRSKPFGFVFFSTRFQRRKKKKNGQREESSLDPAGERERERDGAGGRERGGETLRKRTKDFFIFFSFDVATFTPLIFFK
jgi:hypothetical protein